MELPTISPLGWFHTIIAIVAIISGIVALAKYKYIQFSQTSGKIYIICTLIAAATALMIYQHGAFGPAHVLGVLTLIALGGGVLCEFTNIFGKLSKYLQTLGYSATFMFHAIPAVTDATLRLPVGNPLITNPESPVLMTLYLIILVSFIVGYTAQVLWLRKQTES